MLELLIFIMVNSGVKYPPGSVCYENWDNLNLNQKIELSIGCSQVNGRRVYFGNKLKRIYNE